MSEIEDAEKIWKIDVNNNKFRIGLKFNSFWTGHIYQTCSLILSSKLYTSFNLYMYRYDFYSDDKISFLYSKSRSCRYRLNVNINKTLT